MSCAATLFNHVKQACFLWPLQRDDFLKINLACSCSLSTPHACPARSSINTPRMGKNLALVRPCGCLHTPVSRDWPSSRLGLSVPTDTLSHRLCCDCADSSRGLQELQGLLRSPQCSMGLFHGFLPGADGVLFLSLVFWGVQSLLHPLIHLSNLYKDSMFCSL